MPLAGFYQDVVAAALTPHAQEHTLVFDLLAQFDGLIGAGDGFAVDLQDDIAGLQAGRCRRRARIHVYHQRATAHLVGDVQLPARTSVEICHLHAVERITFGARAPATRPAGFGQAFGGQFAELDGESLFLSIAQGFKCDARAGQRLRGHEAQVAIVGDFFAVEFNDDVAFLQTGFCGGRFRSDFADERASVCG